MDVEQFELPLEGSGVGVTTQCPPKLLSPLGRETSPDPGVGCSKGGGRKCIFCGFFPSRFSILEKFESLRFFLFFVFFLPGDFLPGVFAARFFDHEVLLSLAPIFPET